MRRPLLVLFSSLFAGLPPVWAADAVKGGEVLRESNCLTCHSVRGEGARKALDLASPLVDEYTPAALASVLWNHTGTMWAEMTASVTPQPRLSESDAEDLFAYLYAVRFANQPASSQRGATTFLKKGCSECHSTRGPGPAPAAWRNLADPLALAQAMWNHGSGMKEALAKAGHPWPAVTGRELADISTFAQELQGKPSAQSAPPLPDPRNGQPWFEANCASCHRGGLALERRLANQTPFEIAAGMWNHLQRMQAFAIPSAAQMRSIVAYVWELQYTGVPGNAIRGGQIFEKKTCATCHNQTGTGASTMARGEGVMSAFGMLSLGWRHGPQMYIQLTEKKIRWPHLSEQDVADLVAYLNTRQ